MAEIENITKYKTQLYKALMEGDEEEVIHICSQIEEGPLNRLTIHFDTVLHMATYSKQTNLVLKLLNLLPTGLDSDSFNLSNFQNDIGNTVLHEAATSGRMVPAAAEMLRICPALLSQRNFRGETAVFRAARYGEIDMFRFLDGEVINFVEGSANYIDFHVRGDGTNILHIAILSEQFDMALLIVQSYDYLAGEKDGDGMTPLQLLSCNPSAFSSGNKKGSINKLFYTRVPAEDSGTTREVETCCRVPFWESIQSERRKCESALQLAKYLIKKDTSWEKTEAISDKSKPTIHESLEHSGTMAATTKHPETPLILATKFGCTEIVREILHQYPQAVEHVDAEGRNILHVAIKYRRIEIFDIVEKMEIPMIRLIQKIDNCGNSILHMVGVQALDDECDDMRSPALRLQETLLLFERVQNISTAHFIKHYNNEGQTTDMLLNKCTAQLRNDAKEWLKRTAENCSIVAVLIATVAFAAAYTIPGGPNQETGYPILLNQRFFIIFTMADVLSLAFALTSVITFLSILTSPFRLKDFKQYLPQKLMLGVTLLILSVSMMMFAFAATIILMTRQKEKWTKIALTFVAFFPFTIFAVSYLPLYASLMETFMYSLRKIEPTFPCCNRGHLYKYWLANVFRFKSFQATNDSLKTRSQASKAQTTRYPV